MSSRSTSNTSSKNNYIFFFNTYYLIQIIIYIYSIIQNILFACLKYILVIRLIWVKLSLSRLIYKCFHWRSAGKPHIIIGLLKIWELVLTFILSFVLLFQFNKYFILLKIVSFINNLLFYFWIFSLQTAIDIFRILVPLLMLFRVETVARILNCNHIDSQQCS